MKRWIPVRALPGLLLCALFLSACSPVPKETVPEPVTLVMENLILDQEMPDLPLVEEAVNRILEPELGCRVRIKNIPIASQRSSVRLMIAQQEPLDLICTGRTDPLEEMVLDGLLIPLDDLLDSRGPHLLEAYRELYPTCRIEGRIYAVPAQPASDSAVGFVYNADLASPDKEAFSSDARLEAIEQTAALLHERGIYLLCPESTSNTHTLFPALFPQIQPVSRELYCGCLLEGESDTNILNPYETEAFLEYCRRMRKWREAGWIPENFLFSGQNGRQLFREGKVFMSWSGVNLQEQIIQAHLYSFPLGMLATGKARVTTRTVQESGWGISSSCAHPEKAMELLDYLYTHPAVSNLLANGLEGREYQRVSEHVIARPADSAGEAPGYGTEFSTFGNPLNNDVWAPMTEDEYAALSQACEAPQHYDSLFGYTFLSSSVLPEIAAVREVLDVYIPPLECGMVPDVDAGVAELQARLREAGIDRIIAENQRQLDAWLAERAAGQSGETP